MPFCPSLALPYSVWVLRSFPVSLVVANGAETAALRNPKHQAGVALASRYASTTHFVLRIPVRRLVRQRRQAPSPPTRQPPGVRSARPARCSPFVSQTSSRPGSCPAPVTSWATSRSTRWPGVIRPSPLAGEGLGGMGNSGSLAPGSCACGRSTARPASRPAGGLSAFA
jgi:hypothetical protein